MLKEAPHTRPVKRLDEVRAAKDPVVIYGFPDEPEPHGKPPKLQAAAPQSG